MRSEINAIILAILTTAISLFALYYPKFRILIIILSSITFVAYILFLYLNKIEENKKEIKELKKSFKRAEDLIEIRSEIKLIKDKLR